MGKTVSHHISLRTVCQHTKTLCAAGLRLGNALGDAMNQAAPVPEDGFEISGYSGPSQRPQECLVGWHAMLDAVYLFGDVTERQALDDLVSRAQHMIEPIPDHTSNVEEKPARVGEPLYVPAAIMDVEFESRVRVAA